jgi:hypothetical protein
MNSLKSYDDYFVNETKQRFVVQELKKKKGKCNFLFLYFSKSFLKRKHFMKDQKELL